MGFVAPADPVLPDTLYHQLDPVHPLLANPAESPPQHKLQQIGCPFPYRYHRFPQKKLYVVVLHANVKYYP